MLILFCLSVTTGPMERSGGFTDNTELTEQQPQTFFSASRRSKQDGKQPSAQMQRVSRRFVTPLEMTLGSVC
jgi:hypothetical protein